MKEYERSIVINKEEMREQILYWKRNPVKFEEFVIGRKLRLYEKLYFKLFEKISKVEKYK